MEQFYLQIESYLLGELSGPALEAFENALQQDAALVRAVEQHRLLQRRLQGLRLRRKVGVALRESDRRTTRNSFRLPWIAAGLVLMIVAAWFLIRREAPPAEKDPGRRMEQVSAPAKDTQPVIRQTDPQEIPQKNTSEGPAAAGQPARYAALARSFYVPPTEDLIRSAQETQAEKTVLQAAVEAFSQKKFSVAADLLKNDASFGENESGRFLRAHARFETGRFAAAAADFYLLKNSFQFKYEARWNGLLCDIAQGKAKDPDTKARLDAMASDADFPFQARAAALRKAI